MVVTDLGVFKTGRKGTRLTLLETAPGVTVAEIRANTEAEFAVAPGLA